MQTLRNWWPRVSPHLLSLLRVVTALLFMQHGAMKLFGFPGGGHGGPLPPLILTAGILEFVGGALLLLGLGVRPVAFILSGQMAVAYFMAHASKGFFPALNGGELAALYAFVFLYLVAAGGGSWSLDALFRRREPARTEEPVFTHPHPGRSAGGNP